MSICKVCFKKIETSFYSFRKLTLCSKCFNKLTVRFKNFIIDNKKATYIYRYDDALKSLIYQFKGCYDIELKDIFLERYKTFFKLKYRDYILVPLPSTKEDDEIRGFNHVIEAFGCLNLDIEPIIYKKQIFKQSDLSKHEREKIVSRLGVKDLNKVRNKKILIIDDIITTGSSIRAAINLISKGNPKKIEVLIISKHD